MTVTLTSLNSETQAFLNQFEEVMGSIAHLPVHEQRKTIKEMFTPKKEDLEPIHRVEEKFLQGKNGDLPLRILSPENPQATLLYLHRGGWVYGSNDESEALCRKLANATNSTVVMVEYSLAPENKFPIPLEDCYDTLTWVEQNYKNVIVIGESAGGNLAAALTLMPKASSMLKGQILLYPILTNTLNKEHYDNSPDKSFLSYDNMTFFWDQYLPDAETGKKPLASPLNAPSHENLPPAFIATAEFDALQHEGKKYAELLGNTTTYRHYPAVLHGFLDLPIPVPQIDTCIQDIKTFINGLL